MNETTVITCPRCGKRFRVKAGAAGKSGRCPNPDCHEAITVPNRVMPDGFPLPASTLSLSAASSTRATNDTSNSDPPLTEPLREPPVADHGTQAAHQSTVPTVEITCPSCWQPFHVNPENAAERTRCPNASCDALVDIQQAINFTTKSRSLEHTLHWFPAALVLVLGLLTSNLFTVIWLLFLHDKFPRRRPNDPSAFRAIVFLFIPFFNVLWLPFALIRLVTRLNEQRRQEDLPELQLTWLVIVLTVCALIPVLAFVCLPQQLAVGVFVAGGLLNWLIFVPLLGTSIQNAVNALVECGKASNASQRGAFLVRTELKWRARQRVLWAVYLGLLLCMLALREVVTPLGADREVNFVGFSVFVLPLLFGIFSLAIRASIMRARQARLDEDPGSVDIVVAAERRTSWVYHVVWFALFLLIALGVSVIATIEGDMLFLLAPVVPAWTAALHLLCRVLQGSRLAPWAAARPAGALQAEPMPQWPLVIGATMVVLVVAAMVVQNWSGSN